MTQEQENAAGLACPRCDGFGRKLEKIVVGPTINDTVIKNVLCWKCRGSGRAC